ncbi:MAG: hypothetical protein HRU09_08690 [Oligoflexales bacterium]|nr:hypothetical protein [Oligoflexales bacterium]
MNFQSNHKKPFSNKNRPYKQNRSSNPKGGRQRESKPKNYSVVFYDTFIAAKSDAQAIKEQCQSCDQLNLVIKAEGNMDDAELLGIDSKIKVYAGAAWTSIHERRKEEGWYDSPWKI